MHLTTRDREILLHTSPPGVRSPAGAQWAIAAATRGSADFVFVWTSDMNESLGLEGEIV